MFRSEMRWIFSEVKDKIWAIYLFWRVAQPYNVWRSIRRFVAEKARIYVGWLQQKCVWNMRSVLKYVQKYTQVCFYESAYIRRFSEEKARMKSRVLLKYVEWNVWSVLLFYCYLSMMYSYRSGLFEYWLCYWLCWLKIKLLVDWLMIQWMNWWGYKFLFVEL